MEPIVHEALQQLKLEATIKTTFNPSEIERFGSPELPAVLVNHRWVVQGHTPNAPEMARLIEDIVTSR